MSSSSGITWNHDEEVKASFQSLNESREGVIGRLPRNELAAAFLRPDEAHFPSVDFSTVSVVAYIDLDCGVDLSLTNELPPGAMVIGAGNPDSVVQFIQKQNDSLMMDMINRQRLFFLVADKTPESADLLLANSACEVLRFGSGHGILHTIFTMDSGFTTVVKYVEQYDITARCLVYKSNGSIPANCSMADFLDVSRYDASVTPKASPADAAAAFERELDAILAEKHRREAEECLKALRELQARILVEEQLARQRKNNKAAAKKSKKRSRYFEAIEKNHDRKKIPKH